MSLNYQDNLQKWIYQRLQNDEELTALGAELIADSVPSDQSLPDIYILIGNETTRDQSSTTHEGIEVMSEIRIYSRLPSYANSKKIASRICQLLKAKHENLPEARIVYARFLKSQNYQIDGGRLKLTKLWFTIFLDTTTN